MLRKNTKLQGYVGSAHNDQREIAHLHKHNWESLEPEVHDRVNETDIQVDHQDLRLENDNLKQTV